MMSSNPKKQPQQQKQPFLHNFGIIVRSETFILHMLDSLIAAMMADRFFVKESKKCGCVSCLKVFSTRRLKRQLDNNEGAIKCPFCKKRALIYDTCGYNINLVLLTGLNSYMSNENNVYQKFINHEIFYNQLIN